MNRLLRWAARLGSVAVAGFVALLWYHQPPRLTDLPVRAAGQLALLMLAVAGLLLGWWRERLGGAVAVAGFAGLLLLEGITKHQFPVVPPLFVMLLPALLYLVVGPPVRSEPASPA
jgi:hypothetical protein